jgi:hypothetical protein
MLAGEIQLHLLPTIDIDSMTLRTVPAPRVWPLAAFAEQSFQHARSLDPDFTPPLTHLAEMAARRGDADRVATLWRAVDRANHDSSLAKRMDIVERCLRLGAQQFPWASDARTNANLVYRVGLVFQGADTPRARQCGLSAFSSVLAADTAVGGSDWASLVALNGMLVASGQPDRAVQLLDSAVAHGMPAALGLYVLDAAAGVDVGDRASTFVAQLTDKLDSRPAPSLWLLAVWSSQVGDVDRLNVLDSLFRERLVRGASRLDSLVAAITAARASLARRDTAAAIKQFAALKPTANRGDVENSLWESLAAERLVYARLLLASGQPVEAHRVASVVDHPGITIHQLFLRPSLALRMQAATTLKDAALIQEAKDRMAMLASARLP